MKENKWVRLLAYITGLVYQELLLQNEYLAAENRILRAHLPCPSSKMRLTTKVRVSNGSGGSVSGDPQIEICGMQQGVTSLLRPARGSLYAS